MKHIYCLVDPRTSHVRYVGITDNPDRRLSQHRWGGQRSTGPWCTELRALGLRPIMVVVQSTPHAGVCAENYWIGHFRALGAKLLNRPRTGSDRKGKHYDASVSKYV